MRPLFCNLKSCSLLLSGKLGGSMGLAIFADVVILVILLHTTRTVDCHTNCPKDWSEYDYYCYYLNTNTYTWGVALEWCRNVVDGGDLVSILSSGENSHVKDMISDTIHIGFSDLSLESDWQWTDGRSVSYTNWNSGEPSGNSGLGNMAGMYTSGAWDDYDGSTAERQFVCKVAKEWTAVQTGCQCSFDSTRYDCACCRDGGCNCGISYPNQCVLCGDTGSCGQDYAEPIDQWKVVFKAVSSLNNLYVRDLWTGSSTYNDGDTNAPYISYTSDHYKGSDANSWDTSSLTQVKFAFFDGGVEKTSLVFDTSGTSRTNWFSVGSLTHAPYSDIYTAGYNYFSIDGHDSTTLGRHFFASYEYSGCEGDSGWVVVSDPSSSSGGCDWDNKVTRPGFLYSTATTRQGWHSGAIATAPVMAILYKEPADTSDELCDSGWTHKDNGCYKVYEDTKTWFEAVDACRALGDDVDLVSIHSYDEAMHILGMSRWTYGTSSFWIGLHDLDEEDDWQWIDGTPYDYSRWYSNEPSNGNGMEDCALLLWTTDGTWGDVSCSNTYGYMCKYSLDVASCAEWKRKGYTSSGYFTIDPDGPYNGVDPFRVYCDMSSATDGITVFHHNQETRGYVTGYESYLSYAVDVVYKNGVTAAQMGALADISNNCWQYIKYECYGSVMKHSGTSSAGWYDRSGNVMANWAGAPIGQALCACGSNSNCDNGMSTCSCDVNDNVWRYDDGTITDKAYLPVTKLAFGDTGDASESGYHTLGAFYCQGDSSDVLSSRSDFYLIPYSYINGYNNQELSSTSLSDCAGQCSSATSFVCRSFDYDVSSSYCSLSEYNHIMSDGVTGASTMNLYVRKFDAGTNLFVETNNCNSGWVEYSSKCYYISTTTRTWYDAETWCQSQGGHLTSTADANEYAFLRKMLRWSLVTTDDFLIGYNDIEEEGTWTEADSTQHSFTRWRNGEPSGAALENAAVMYARDYDDWIDVNVESSYQFICKASAGASAIAQPTVNPTCASGWTSHGDSCYYFSSDTQKYGNARDECKSMSSDLLVIDTTSEWAYVNSYIRYRYYTRNYWVGLSDALEEGTWVWVNGALEDTTSTYWISGAPDNSGGSEHCARLDENYGYQDVGCTSAIYYICEDDLYITSAPNSIGATVKSSSSVEVTWSDPAQIDGQNGDLVGYKLYYWIKDRQSETTDSVLIDSSTTYTVTLDALVPATTYEYYMTAYNSFGEGPDSDPPGNFTTRSAKVRGSTYALGIFRIARGKIFKNHLVSTKQAYSLKHCVNICTAVKSCQSVNFNENASSDKKTCELNDATKEAYANDVTDDANYVYAGL